MANKIKLICKRVIFYSSIDEDLFFEWIKKISVIVDIKGISDEIHVYVTDSSLDRISLMELNALFKRYKIDRKQLQVFLNDSSLNDGDKLWLK